MWTCKPGEHAALAVQQCTIVLSTALNVRCEHMETYDCAWRPWYQQCHVELHGNLPYALRSTEVCAACKWLAVRRGVGAYWLTCAWDCAQVFLEDAGFDWKILGPDVAEPDYVAWQCDQDAYACSGQKCSAQSILFMHENWAAAGAPPGLAGPESSRHSCDAVHACCVRRAEAQPAIPSCVCTRTGQLLTEVPGLLVSGCPHVMLGYDVAASVRQPSACVARGCSQLLDNLLVCVQQALRKGSGVGGKVEAEQPVLLQLRRCLK